MEVSQSRMVNRLNDSFAWNDLIRRYCTVSIYERDGEDSISDINCCWERNNASKGTANIKDRERERESCEMCTFFENPSELILEGRILNLELLDEILRINRIIVLAPPSTRDLPQRGTGSLSIRVIMQRQHYFPSSLPVTGLLPTMMMISILSAMTSPWKFALSTHCH